jgi:hypothetical protein
MSKIKMRLYAAALLGGTFLAGGCLGLGGGNFRLIWAILREDLFS